MIRSARRTLQAMTVQLAVLVATVIGIALFVPQFRGETAVYATLSTLALLGLLTMAVAVTMVAGELDLSVTSLAALSGALAVRWGELGLAPAVILSTCVVVAIGTLQGYTIHKFRVNSLVFTLSTGILLSGVAWTLCGNKPLPLTDYTVSDPLYVRIGVLSPDSAVALVVIVLLGLMLAITRWGRELYAIGGARTEAVAAGVSERRSLLLAFGTSGFCSGVAGALSSLKSGSATPDGYADLLLVAVAAALIGGVGLSGGQGGALQVLLGVTTLGALSAGLAMNGSGSFVTQLITGLLLFAVVGLELLLRLVRNHRRRHAAIGHRAVLSPT